MGCFVVGYTAQTGSLLFEQEAAKRSKNGVKSVSRLRARLGALPVKFWMLTSQKFSIRWRQKHSQAKRHSHATMLFEKSDAKAFNL